MLIHVYLGFALQNLFLINYLFLYQKFPLKLQKEKHHRHGTLFYFIFLNSISSTLYRIN